MKIPLKILKMSLKMDQKVMKGKLLCLTIIIYHSNNSCNNQIPQEISTIIWIITIINNQKLISNEIKLEALIWIIIKGTINKWSYSSNLIIAADYKQNNLDIKKLIIHTTVIQECKLIILEFQQSKIKHLILDYKLIVM